MTKISSYPSFWSFTTKQPIKMNTANRLILWSGLIVLLFTGTVRDRETRKKLVNVTVALAGSSIATDYNIIEPTESLEKAVKKLRKSL